MANAAHEDSVLPRPVQEEGDQKTAAALLNQLFLRHLQQLNPHELNLLSVDAMKSNPDVLNQVLSLAREKAKRSNRLQVITCFLLAAARRSYNGAKFLFLLLLNTLYGVVKIEPEIPRERHAQLDEIKSSLGEVETKLEKVQHDTGKMEEKIQTAFKNDFKISCNDNKKLEIGLVTAKCDLDSCQDILSRERDAIDGMQRRANEAIASVHIKLLAITLIVITGTVFLAALAAGFLHHSDGLEKEHSRGGRFDTDDDEDVKGKRSMTSFMLMGGLIVAVMLAIWKQKAQSLFNNQKLLAECEELQKNGLQKAERLQKDLNRDIEYKLPECKKRLDVLDIDVSLYASLHPHYE